jgi:hypothetical protein
MSLFIGLRDGAPFRVDANAIATGRTCVIGASGSGKSYAVGVICEELCKNRIPFAIVDTEGEYWGLRERYEVIWIGEDVSCDVRWERLEPRRLAAVAPESPPLILDVSEVHDRRAIVASVLAALYLRVSELRRPYLIILEEADRFAPQHGERLPIIDEIATKGRKRGMGLLICTQRPSMVHKNILSQCGNQLLGRLIIRNDLEAVAQFFPSREEVKALTLLRPGQFYALGGLSSPPALIQVRPRETAHGGATPQLIERMVRPPLEVLRKLERRRAPTSRLRGLPPLISRDQVPSLVKGRGLLPLLNRREVVVGVRLDYIPLLVASVIVASRLRRAAARKFLLIEASKGAIADVRNGLSLGQGLAEFLGMSSLALRALAELDKRGAMSQGSLRRLLSCTEGQLRSALGELQARGLVRSFRAGAASLYEALRSPPRLRLLESAPIPRGLRLPRRVSGVEASVERLRALVEGLLERAKLEDVRVLLYPIYRVELDVGGKIELRWLDARTGRRLGAELGLLALRTPRTQGQARAG